MAKKLKAWLKFDWQVRFKAVVCLYHTHCKHCSATEYVEITVEKNQSWKPKGGVDHKTKLQNGCSQTNRWRHCDSVYLYIQSLGHRVQNTLMSQPGGNKSVRLNLTDRNFVQSCTNPIWCGRLGCFSESAAVFQLTRGIMWEQDETKCCNLYILHDGGCFSSLRARLSSYKSYRSKNLWPLKCGPSLKRCTKSVSRSVLTALCIEGISGRNIWVRDSGTLEPIMVLRPVKEKSGACFGKAGVIQLFRNALRGNCHKQFAVQSCTLLQETLRRFFKLDVILRLIHLNIKNFSA